MIVDVVVGKEVVAFCDDIAPFKMTVEDCCVVFGTVAVCCIVIGCVVGFCVVGF